jgi:hypothetical protein
MPSAAVVKIATAGVDCVACAAIVLPSGTARTDSAYFSPSVCPEWMPVPDEGRGRESRPLLQYSTATNCHWQWWWHCSCAVAVQSPGGAAEIMVPCTCTERPRHAVRSLSAVLNTVFCRRAPGPHPHSCRPVDVGNPECCRIWKSAQASLPVSVSARSVNTD